MLRANGLADVAKDTRLINHFAYLFIREHPVIFEKNVLEFGKNRAEADPRKWIQSHKLEDNEDVLQNSTIFEAIQSTNWNNMRFKPAKSFGDKNSWLVEFRPLDLPATSREKYHVIYFTSLLQRIVTDPKLHVNFYIPISFADLNMLRCVKRDAVVKQKFYFRRHFFGDKARDDKYRVKSRGKADIESKRKLFIESELVELSLEELMQGGEDHQGIRGLIEYFIESNETFLEEESKRTGENIVDNIWATFDFFLKRSQGKLITTAKLIRNFVREHPNYAFDSVVEGKVADDLIGFLFKVQNDNYHHSLFG